MKFLCLGYFSPARMDALPKAEIEAIMSQCPPHMDTLHATGKIVVEAGVESAAKSVRRAAGGVEVTDGPGDATAEKVGCAFIIEAADMAEAVRIASLHPTTQIPAGEHLGWRIEIRPVHFYYTGGQQSAGG